MSWFASPVRVGRKFIRASGENSFDVSRRSFGEGGRVRHSCSEGGAGLGGAASTPGSAVAKAIADAVELVFAEGSDEFSHLPEQGRATLPRHSCHLTLGADEFRLTRVLGRGSNGSSPIAKSKR
jgi:hypothetical protein